MALPSTGLAGCRALVVEDELLVAMNVEDLLTEQGCEVLESAPTVAKALQSIIEEHPDIVLLDRNLDGERTTAVAEMLNRSGIPYVVVTGYIKGVADDPAMVNAPCVQKPWVPEDLIACLRRALADAQSTPQRLQSL